ncbi:carboxypeptidase-like regulatory domain-containing protein [Pedobacter psychrodurus]|jgi:hypothetical protein|uniref:carboxypeptidase-like regulatory domain-containing protein n=1 Tax=Pedobacter psychrodurus TaxID=2530456 RepID=UPI0029312F57|nr:carboxypeptidase-like regulatory domain-containing protein [Pedobacter psychrodurus]
MNITKILTLLFIFIFKEPLYSQIKVEGYIVDDQRQPIEFVSIHSRRTLLSTATDQKGYFKINVPDDKDSLYITHLSYRSQILAADQITTGSRIMMQKQTNLLEEVVISNKPRSKTVLNPFSKQGSLQYDFGELVAQEYQVNDDGILLDQVKIHFYRDDHFLAGQIKFKFLVYDQNQGGIGPGKLLAEKHCTLTDLRTGTYVVNLSDPIYIPNRVFFLGVEKIISPINERPTIYTAYNSGIKDSYNIRYAPNIYLNQKGKQKYWVLNTSTKKWHADQGILSIEASIKE